MNERIKELAEVASKDNGDGYPVTLEYSNRFAEKFAELIVRECMWKIMNRKEKAIDNDWDVDEAMSAAISDISEHFGVKE